jgi:hypothetical protein
MVVMGSRRVIAVVIAASLPAIVTCSEDDATPGTPGGGTSGASGSAGTGGASGSSSGGSSGSANAGRGGAGGSGGNAGTGGSGAAGGNAGTGNAGGSGGGSGGSAGAAGTTSGDGGPPPPADGGGSIYAVECRGESRPCGFPAAHCLGIQLPDGGAGFTCSNHCQSANDCSNVPSGAEAQADCVQFTQQSRCVLVCENAGTRASCPGGMTCYTYPGSQLGYCLWM